jgi:hypothetical protein
MMTKYRKPTQKEELRAFKGLLHELHLHRAITLDNEKVVAILDRMFSWTSAHNDRNGEAREREIEQAINRAFWERIHGLPWEGHAKPRPHVSKEEAARRRAERERDNGGAGSWS